MTKRSALTILGTLLVALALNGCAPREIRDAHVSGEASLSSGEERSQLLNATEPLVVCATPDQAELEGGSVWAFATVSGAGSPERLRIESDPETGAMLLGVQRGETIFVPHEDGTCELERTEHSPVAGRSSFDISCELQAEDEERIQLEANLSFEGCLRDSDLEPSAIEGLHDPGTPLVGALLVSLASSEDQLEVSRSLAFAVGPVAFEE